jgi:poly(A) polymerase
MAQPTSLAGAPWLVRPSTRAVLAALSAGGYQARVVGGAVRNGLLGRPVVDVDIATTARPDRVMELATAAKLEAIPTGLDHGTVTVVSDRTPFEVTTLRHDVETDGRHARVAYTDDWHADASRRDFTMNALYCDADGTLFDPLGGLPDLQVRRVRFIGDATARIREDYLRILRFFRFHAEVGQGEIDRTALEACVREHAGLSRLSPERIRAELVRLLVADGASGVIGTMHDCGFLPGLFGAAPRPSPLAALIEREVVAGNARDAMLRLSALCIGVEEDCERLAERLRLSRAEQDRLIVFAPPLTALAQLTEPAARAGLYRLGRDRWRREILAGWTMAAAPISDDAWRRLLSLPDRWRPPRFPLRGEDVVAAGIAPGPEIGRILRRLEADWIAGDFADGRDALLARLADMPAGTQTSTREASPDDIDR